MLAWQYFVNFLSKWYSDVKIQALLYPGSNNLNILLWCLSERKKMYNNQDSSCFSNDDDNLTTVITKGSIFLLAMLIFLFDVSVTSSTLKTFMTFWGTCFKLLFRLAFKEGTLDSYKISKASKKNVFIAIVNLCFSSIFLYC